MTTLDAGVSMAQITLDKRLVKHIASYLKKHKKADLVSTYLSFIEEKYDIDPVIFVREKTIYRSQKDLIQQLEEKGKLWRETEVKIQVGQPSVNEETKKIYICPHTGKVYGNNTHPNPQDAIYEWVSKCPENKERVGGLKAKRFFVSEDPDVIKNYIQKRKEPVTKTVYSSAVTGKLFGTKRAVIEDFTSSQLKHIPLPEVTNQNRFTMEDSFLAFIEDELDESKITSFVEALSGHEEFTTHVARWMEELGEE